MYLSLIYTAVKGLLLLLFSFLISKASELKIKNNQLKQEIQDAQNFNKREKDRSTLTRDAINERMQNEFVRKD